MSSLPRAIRNIVSAYQRDRVYQTHLFANESRTLVTDFTGAIPEGETIAKAVWQTWDYLKVAMATPAVDGAKASVRVSAQYCGPARIRLDVTLTNGDTYSAWHIVRVKAAPFFQNPGWVQGPRRLEVTA